MLTVNEPLDSPLPCTPFGIVELLSRNGISLAGKEVLVLGRGVTVGRPLGLLLTRKALNATVTLAHTGTTDLPALLKRADVVVAAAAGVPDIIKATDPKPGVIILDVGVSRAVDPETGKSSLRGDVEAAASKVAAWISLNPGGVGPMTRAMLLSNLKYRSPRLGEATSLKPSFAVQPATTPPAGRWDEAEEHGLETWGVGFARDVFLVHQGHGLRESTPRRIPWPPGR